MRIINVVGARPNFMKIALIMAAYRRVMSGSEREFQTPKLWDGRAAERIVNVLTEHES
jgi:hypothetical protein